MKYLRSKYRYLKFKNKHSKSVLVYRSVTSTNYNKSDNLWSALNSVINKMLN